MLKKIDLGGQFVGHEHRRRRLDHHPDRNPVVERHLLPAQLLLALLQKRQRVAQLRERDDHRKHHPHAAPGTGTQDRPQLRAEHIAQFEAYANSAPAQKKDSPLRGIDSKAAICRRRYRACGSPAAGRRKARRPVHRPPSAPVRRESRPAAACRGTRCGTARCRRRRCGSPVPLHPRCRHWPARPTPARRVS